MSASRTRKRREPGWVEAAAKVIEGLATANGNNLAISQALEIDIADLLKLIQSAKLKTIKGSIDERDALRRSLEQAQDQFYSENDKFGLLKFRPKVETKSKAGTKRKVQTVSGKTSSYEASHRGRPKRKKDNFSETRQRKISTEDLVAPETPLAGVNLRELINEEAFHGLGQHQKWELLKLLPSCDVEIDDNGMPSTSRDAFTNEFFSRSVQLFPERIADGEFTSAMKARLSIESGRRRIDPWKEKFFEEKWGDLMKKEDPRKDAQAEKLRLVENAIAKLSTRCSPKKYTSDRVETLSPKPEPKQEPKPFHLPLQPFSPVSPTEKNVIKSWEAIQAVKTLSSPEHKKPENCARRIVKNTTTPCNDSKSVTFNVIRSTLSSSAQVNHKSELKGLQKMVIVSRPIIVKTAVGQSMQPAQNHCSSVNVSPATSSQVSSNSPASRGPSCSPSTNLLGSDNPVLAIPFACVKSPYTNRITSPERVPILQSPKNSAKTSPSVKPLTMNLPPIPQLIPAPHHGVSQKHKKGRTLAEMRANIQERRQSVIRYCPPGSAIPTRVIKSLQQAVPSDRVLILSPVSRKAGSNFSRPQFRLDSGPSTSSKAEQTYRSPTKLQRAPLTTSVIQTLQIAPSRSPKKTFVIKVNPTVTPYQSPRSSSQQKSLPPLHHHLVAARSHNCKSTGAYAQCEGCENLFNMPESRIRQKFLCSNCSK